MKIATQQLAAEAQRAVGSRSYRAEHKWLFVTTIVHGEKKTLQVYSTLIQRGRCSVTFGDEDGTSRTSYWLLVNCSKESEVIVNFPLR